MTVTVTRPKISLRTSHVTQTQAHHHRQLSLAIDDALQTGLRVPCIENPQAFDETTILTTTTPSPCDGCPVIELCDTYRRTGAVTHGVLANHAMSDPRDDRRRELRARRTPTVARHSAA